MLSTYLNAFLSMDAHWLGSRSAPPDNCRVARPEAAARPVFLVLRFVKALDEMRHPGQGLEK
jgi:hypothetical protein